MNEIFKIQNIQKPPKWIRKSDEEVAVIIADLPKSDIILPDEIVFIFKLIKKHKK